MMKNKNKPICVCHNSASPKSAFPGFVNLCRACGVRVILSSEVLKAAYRTQTVVLLQFQAPR